MSKYKVVFLDWNGTLSDSIFWGHLEGSYKQDFFTKVRDSLFVQHIDFIKPWMRGELTSEEIMQKVSDSTGYSFDEVFNEFKKGCVYMGLADSKIPEIIKKLQAKGIKCVISTDNMDSFTRWTVPNLKLEQLFDEILSSSELKILKREKNVDGKSKFLENYLKKHNLKYTDSLMIDDGNDKEDVMKNSGVTYIKINSSSEVADILSKLL